VKSYFRTRFFCITHSTPAPRSHTYTQNNQTFYDAVWRKSTDGEIQVCNVPFATFKESYDALWCDGWRLKLIDVHQPGPSRFNTDQ
jgi:hypothetical protein